MEFPHLLCSTVKLAKLRSAAEVFHTNVSDVDAYVRTRYATSTSSGILFQTALDHGILTNTQQFKLTNNGRRKIKETEGTYN